MLLNYTIVVMNITRFNRETVERDLIHIRLRVSLYVNVLIIRSWMYFIVKQRNNYEEGISNPNVNIGTIY